MSKNLAIAALAASLSSIVLAGATTVTMDGQLDAAYGDALAVQDTQTQFGNSNLGSLSFANGSELDVAHGFVDTDAGVLRLFIGGNLESNFNKFELFIDYTSGGQNKLRGDNPDVDFNGLNRMGDDGSGNGLIFDEGFEADFYLTLTCGNSPLSTFANTAELLTNGGGAGGFIGSGSSGTSILSGSNGTLIALDNSNTGGVDGGTGLASGAGVTTGIEIAIPLSLFAGYADGDIKVTAFINGGGHDFLSNQVIAGIGGGGNLGEPRFVNFSAISGDQFFVVPGPTAPVAGDLDGNGSVDGADLAILLGGWGPCPRKGGCAADLDGNGVVDGADLAILLGSWG
jgi:hypothetical protein